MENASLAITHISNLQPFLKIPMAGKKTYLVAVLHSYPAQQLPYVKRSLS